MMAYKTVAMGRQVQKGVHAFLHLSALVLGITGLCATFKFHDMVHLEDMQSLHSWIGLGTFILFCLQVTTNKSYLKVILSAGFLTI